MAAQTIPSGGASIEDRRSLYAVQMALTARGTLRYLEVGCYLGATIESFLTDPGCGAVTAIDRRDAVSPDVRGPIPYPDNTTAHMISLLARVPGADLDKLTTIDASTDELDPSDYRADLCFIDAEHTDRAVLGDARFCRRVVRDCGVIAFHDRTLVEGGIRRFLRELSCRYRVYPLKHDLLLVELGVPSLLADVRVRAQVPRTAWLVADRLRAVPLALGLTSALRRRNALSPG